MRNDLFAPAFVHGTLCRQGKVANNLPIVLIVEDEFAIQIVVEEALSDAGFETAVAPSAEEAVTKSLCRRYQKF
jgi:ActR/RegA family two-component response regulator